MSIMSSTEERLSTLATIASRLRRGTTSRKSSSRLGAASLCWIDKPVMFPPGRARLATRPAPTGSPTDAKTIGMTVVARLAAATAAVPWVMVTSTLRRTNSLEISAFRAPLRPPVLDCDVATFHPTQLMKSSHECSNHVAHGRRRACAQEPYRWQPGRLLRACGERHKSEIEH